MQLIPAIDLRNGQCVRLFQGDFAQTTVYGEDPAAQAQAWQAAGAERLHIVDLDGARLGRPTQTDTIRAIVEAVDIPVQLGGGLRDAEAVASALALGLRYVILGTIAVEQPDLVKQLVAEYGDAIIVGIDARDGIVATAGWLNDGGIAATALAQTMAEIGVQQIIYTDISRDGTLSEPNYAATAALIQPHGPAIIASGGISRTEQLHQLAQDGIAGAIVGTALYTGHINLQSALEQLTTQA